MAKCVDSQHALEEVPWDAPPVLLIKKEGKSIGISCLGRSEKAQEPGCSNIKLLGPGGEFSTERDLADPCGLYI